jgi:uncharacterized caspase-like protein
MGRLTQASIAVALYVSMTVLAAAANQRAFVVGINIYDNLPPDKQLVKAVNDSRVMAATFRDLGFTVLQQENVGLSQFYALWQRFLDSVQPGDVVAVFFSGHGVEINGVNYLIPRDTPELGAGEVMLMRQSASLNGHSGLMADLKKRQPRISLMIIDACRDNPYAAGSTKSIGKDLGLAPVEPPEGMFVMYSAGAGEKSLDRLYDRDPESTSVYTRRLIPLLKTPGLTLPEVGQQVRMSVRDLARTAQPPRAQTPAYYDQLVGRYCLSGCSDGGPQQNSAADQGPSAAAREWATVDKSSLAELQTFKDRYPGTSEAAYADARARDLRQKEAMLRPPPRPEIRPLPRPEERPRRPALEDVGGAWRGTYMYADNKPPVVFDMTINVSGNSCGGRIEEPNTFGHRSVSKLFANVACRVDTTSAGVRLVFRKTYDGTGGQSHSVDYAGEISPDGRTVTGTWSIGSTTGRFSLSKQ